MNFYPLPHQASLCLSHSASRACIMGIFFKGIRVTPLCRYLHFHFVPIPVLHLMLYCQYTFPEETIFTNHLMLDKKIKQYVTDDKSIEFILKTHSQEVSTHYSL